MSDKSLAIYLTIPLQYLSVQSLPAISFAISQQHLLHNLLGDLIIGNMGMDLGDVARGEIRNLATQVCNGGPT